MYKNSVDSIVENVSRVLHDSLKPFLNELETNAKFGERFLSLISELPFQQNVNNKLLESSVKILQLENKISKMEEIIVYLIQEIKTFDSNKVNETKEKCETKCNEKCEEKFKELYNTIDMLKEKIDNINTKYENNSNIIELKIKEKEKGKENVINQDELIKTVYTSCFVFDKFNNKSEELNKKNISHHNKTIEINCNKL